MTDDELLPVEAAGWVARMDSGAWNAESELQLQSWLDEDPKHPGELLHAQALWVSLDDKAAELPTASQNRLGRRALLGGMAAGIAAVAGGGTWLWTNGWQSYDTEVGEIRRVPLADGSSATINTASKVDVKFSDHRRRIVLERGEAWFQVAHDKAKPFIVEAGRVRVVAVGTAFSVRRKADGADVLVTEGVIEAWAAGAEGHKITLGAGQRAFIADNAAIVQQPTAPSSVDRTLAWRSGKIDLVGETLADAAAEFNRYNEVQIIVADPKIASERFDGVFRIDDPEGFAAAVEQSLNVPVKREDARTLRIG